MDTKTAKKIIARVAPALIVTDQPGYAHLNLQRREGGPVHSIMMPGGIPGMPTTDAEDERMLIDAVRTAERMLPKE